MLALTYKLCAAAACFSTFVPFLAVLPAVAPCSSTTPDKAGEKKETGTTEGVEEREPTVSAPPASSFYTTHSKWRGV